MVSAVNTAHSCLRWLECSATQQGNAHVLRGRPNQDAFYCKHLRKGKAGLIVVVSDGHGGDRYVRSQNGAKLAVRVAAKYLEQRLAPFWEQTGEPRRLSRSDFEDEVSTALVRLWRKQVQKHAEMTPWTEAERQQGWNETSEATLHTAYGATLLFVAALPGFVIYGQLGDGDILCVSRGGAVSRPIERSASSFANETLSLCSRDAAANLKVHVQSYDSSSSEGRNPAPALILLATDGYANSFATEAGFIQAAADIHAYLGNTNGYQQVKRALPQWLEQCSRNGSGDDVTVALVFPEDSVSTRARGGQLIV